MSTPDGAATGVLAQRAVVVTAAVRAALAWSGRAGEPRAFDEVARMTGVIMHELGPGRGPTTPNGLVTALRQPLRGILPHADSSGEGWPGGEVDDLVLLTDDGDVTDEALGIGSDFISDLLTSRDPGRDWLPSWSWMRAEQVENALFGRLIAAGSAEAYTKARRFVVEYPAGDRRELAEEANRIGADRVATYVDIPADQVHADNKRRWWWPCPVCRWPMHVDGVYVRCRYRPHHAVFQVQTRGTGRRVPGLIRVDHTGRGRQIPTARAADGAVQVLTAEWRYVVVPGAAELRLLRDLEKLGATAVLYPDFDRCDLEVTTASRKFTIDVKEHATVEALIRHLKEDPPRAKYIVLPESHADQLAALSDGFGQYVFRSERRLRSEVRNAMKGAR